jgi:hypothetical protein
MGIFFMTYSAWTLPSPSDASPAHPIAPDDALFA